MVDCENAVFQVTAGCITIAENILFPGTDSQDRLPGQTPRTDSQDRQQSIEFAAPMYLILTGIVGCDIPGRLTLDCDGVVPY